MIYAFVIVCFVASYANVKNMAHPMHNLKLHFPRRRHRQFVFHHLCFCRMMLAYTNWRPKGRSSALIVRKYDLNNNMQFSTSLVFACIYFESLKFYIGLVPVLLTTISYIESGAWIGWSHTLGTWRKSQLTSVIEKFRQCAIARNIVVCHFACTHIWLFIFICSLVTV